MAFSYNDFLKLHIDKKTLTNGVKKQLEKQGQDSKFVIFKNLLNKEGI